MKLQLNNNKAYELNKTAKADEVFALCIKVIEDNPNADIVELFKEIRTRYLEQTAPMYLHLRFTLEDMGITQKEIADVLAITPQDINRRFSGGVKWKPLEKRVLLQYLEERGGKYTEEELFSK